MTPEKLEELAAFADSGGQMLAANFQDSPEGIVAQKLRAWAEKYYAIATALRQYAEALRRVEELEVIRNTDDCRQFGDEPIDTLRRDDVLAALRGEQGGRGE